MCVRVGVGHYTKMHSSGNYPQKADLSAEELFVCELQSQIFTSV